MTITSLDTYQIYENTSTQMEQFYLSAALQANQILIDSTHISGNQSLSIKKQFTRIQDSILYV